FVSDRAQVPAFDAVFLSVFGAQRRPDEPDEPERSEGAETEPAPPDEREPASVPGAPAGEEHDLRHTSVRSGRRRGDAADARDVPVRLMDSEDELLGTKRFDALAPDEPAQLHRLMSKLSLATPRRLTRRAERRRHGRRIDLRRTLRSSMRTGGDPIRVARRER